MPIALNEDVRNALDAQRDALAEKTVARQYELEPESWRPYGSAGRRKCVQDARYHLMYLSGAVGASSPAVFADYVGWLRILFAGLGFPDATVEVTLNCMRYAIGDLLPPAMATLADEYLSAAVAQASNAPLTVPSFIRAGNPLAALAGQYLDAVLHSKRQQAVRLIVEAAANGASVKDIYLHVFQPVQYEIGRLWQMNRISVAQEHFCTAATQLAMAQLYPYVFTSARIGRRLLATCVSGELHEIGARIVADLFEIEGWDTCYLGANTPVDAILDMLDTWRPDVLAVSATMTFHVRAVADLIARLRAVDRGGHLPVVVGGYPFNVAPGLWRQIGADGSAPDALQAIAVAERLAGEAAGQ